MEVDGNSQAIVAVPGQTEPFTSTAIVPSSDVRTAGFNLSEIKKLATQTKAIGVILPPPDIRAIVDKTASFVAKHGGEFEKRILANERNNAKFNFLVPTDPYHAYYQMRIKNFKDEAEGGDGAAKADKGDANAAAAELGNAVATGPQVIPHALAKLEKPEDEHYTVHIPQGLSLLELDIIKLSAQFVARNGKSFLNGLASREHTNPLFNFLRPTHSLYGFFTALCDAYSTVLMPPKGTKDKMQKDATDSAALLERCMKRLEWERVREREIKDAADEAEKERLAYQSIDWHEFVVVETIEFEEGEDDELPPPITLKDVINMNKAREYAALEEQEQAEADKAAAEKGAQAVAMSEEERALVAQAAAVSLNPAGQPPQAPGAVTSAPDTQGGGEMHEAEMELDEEEAAPPTTRPPIPDEEDEEPIKVVKDYVRPTQRMALYNGQPYDPTKFVVSPITGELVAINDMAEHMRISLIDPRWKEQRESMLSKIRDNTKAQDDEITRNLTGLAKTRPDIFGSTEEEVTQVVSESIREKLTSGANRPVAWDGVTQKGPELAAQIANIQQNRGNLAPGAQGGRPGAGPAAPPATSGAVAAARAAQMAAQQQQQMPRAPTSLPPPPPLASLPRPPTLPPPPRAPLPGQIPPMPPPPMAGMPMRPPGPPVALPPPPGAGGGGPMGGPPGSGMPPPPARAPAPPREAPPPMPGDQPDAKRQRMDDGMFVLQPEEEFLAQYPGASSVRVQCPEVEGNDKLIGQLLEVQVASLQDTVGEFKERLSSVLALPAGKMKLSRDEVGFLRDEQSLAHYNVGPHVVLTLGLKERARGRKN